MALPNAPTLIDVRQLRLADACALLAHGSTGARPALEDSPVEYFQSVIDGLCELSLKDPLTGLANRRHFRAILEREIDIVARSGESALLLMLDTWGDSVPANLSASTPDSVQAKSGRTING